MTALSPQEAAERGVLLGYALASSGTPLSVYAQALASTEEEVLKALIEAEGSIPLLNQIVGRFIAESIVKHALGISTQAVRP